MDVVDLGGETGDVIADGVVHGAPGEPFIVVPEDDGVTSGCAVTVSARVEGVVDGVERSVASVGDVDAEGAQVVVAVEVRRYRRQALDGSGPPWSSL